MIQDLETVTDVMMMAELQSAIDDWEIKFER